MVQYKIKQRVNRLQLKGHSYYIRVAVPETTVKNVLENPYAVGFCWKKEYLAVLKACFYIYSKASV